MALTDYDKKNLSSNDQKKIQAATNKWNAANAKGDKAGMAAAAAEAAAVRNNAGYKTDSSGNYAGSTGNTYNGSSGVGTSKGGNSQYTGNSYTIGSDKGQNIATNMPIGSTYNASDGSLWTKEKDGTITVSHGGNTYKNAYAPSDYSVVIQQMIDAGVPYSYVEEALGSRTNKALNEAGLYQYAYDDVYKAAQNYILNAKKKENQANAELDFSNWQDDYLEDNPRPTAPKDDPRVEEYLNQILNRDAFSYDALSDPLYQQYAESYRREGDRAMRDTLAEVAAGAGGMNSYAITAAQQANSYYNSQLNDKIPELYQLAYQMYLNDIDLKVQDLGLLQDMSDRQYNRYRDTMSDWYNDKNFAYGAYHDAVQQGNWLTNFDYNAMVDDRNWTSDNYWANKEWNYNDTWKNKEWDEKQENKEYDRSQAEREAAQAEIDWLIKSGVSSITDTDLIKRAGLDDAEVKQMIAYFQQQQAKTGGKSSSRSTIVDDEDDDKKKVEDDDVDETVDTDGNPKTASTYETVFNDCNNMIARGETWEAAAYAKEALDAGIITMAEYSSLLNRNNPLLNAVFVGTAKK